MSAQQLISCLIEKASLETGLHVWGLFEVVAGRELGKTLCYCRYEPEQDIAILHVDLGGNNVSFCKQFNSEIQHFVNGNCKTNSIC